MDWVKSLPEGKTERLDSTKKPLIPGDSALLGLKPSGLGSCVVAVRVFLEKSFDVCCGGPLHSVLALLATNGFGLELNALLFVENG